MFTKIRFDKERDLNSDEFMWIIQLVSFFAYYNSYNVAVSSQEYDDFMILVIDSGIDLQTNMISIEGSKFSMVALREEFMEKFGAANSVSFSR